MRPRPTTPPTSPTPSGSTDAPPKNPGASAPGPTLIDLTQPIVLEITAEFSDTVEGQAAAEALGRELQKAKRARECGGIRRLK